MSEQLKESLSAAIDDEADAFELRRVLDEASSNSELREKWHRMHLLRDILRDDADLYNQGFRDQVWNGLLESDDQGEEHTRETLEYDDKSKVGRPMNPWLGRATGVAVAVFAAVLVLINGGVFESNSESNQFAGSALQQSEISRPGANNNRLVNSPALVGTEGHLAPVSHPSITPADRSRQNGFMIHHIQQRALNQGRLTSLVKVATFSSAANRDNTGLSADPDTNTDSEEAVDGVIGNRINTPDAKD